MTSHGSGSIDDAKNPQVQHTSGTDRDTGQLIRSDELVVRTGWPAREMERRHQAAACTQ